MIVLPETGAHYEVSHFCAGCPVGDELHTGCVTDGSVVIYRLRKPADPLATPPENLSAAPTAAE